METSDIIQIMILILTAIGLLITVHKGFKNERIKNEEWKTEREKTDDSQDNAIKQHSKEIKENAEEIKQNKIELAKHKKEVDAKFLTVEKKIADNYSALMQATNDSIKELIPVIKERDNDLYEKLIISINHKDELTKKELENLKNELDKKTNRRVKK